MSWTIGSRRGRLRPAPVGLRYEPPDLRSASVARRAPGGPPKAEPGADAGPAAPRSGAALVLLATFASLRWGEVIALRRCDLDLNVQTVRVRAAYVERSTGEILLGRPKLTAGRRVVGIPDAIIPALREHLAVFVKDEPGALVFPAPRAARCAVATSTRWRPGRTR